MSDKSTTSGGVGVFGLLLVLFVGLKLTHVIDWPWMAVTAPIWAPFSLFVLAFIVIAAFGGGK